MKIIILLGLLRATLSAPLAPQRLLSASNSNELLLNLNNARLLPLQLQGPFNSLTPPFSGILHQRQQAQTPGLPQFSSPSQDLLAGLFPNQIPFPGQTNFPQVSQPSQMDFSQPQTPVQTQQGTNPVLPYSFSFKLPQEQTQMLHYYPVFMYLPWEQSLPTSPSTQLPQQAGQQQFEVEVPFYTQFEYIPQQADTVLPGGQQQLAFDPLIGTAPETTVKPAGAVITYIQRERANSRRPSAGIVRPSASPKPSTANIFTSARDPIMTPEFMEEKVAEDQEREKRSVGSFYLSMEALQMKYSSSQLKTLLI
ncbi:odontogenic ameloblast-associated protein [Tenrec ecaudatus]|uniref:odontogenic ameloblast-associated protein n=1 Tax=Tenrec ecaudatus TaxID=94439 RepID=UPI003F5A3DD1